MVQGRMTDDEILHKKKLIAHCRDQIEAYECTRDDTIAVLVNESLARRRTHPTDEEEEMVEEVPADASDTETSGWDCPDVRNVYGFCIYNEDEDPCHDNCLFCHHPEERK